VSDEVRLADVTAANRAAVIALELAEDQQDLVSSNADSLDDARHNRNARPRAIYAGETLVGFLMYDAPDGRDEPDQATIYRFMIDKAFQAKGYGRAALQCAIEEIRRVPGIRRILILYVPDNDVARAFYASLGFVELGLDEDEEMIAELRL
jgi:diamine N-acetyltransferase